MNDLYMSSESRHHHLTQTNADNVMMVWRTGEDVMYLGCKRDDASRWNHSNLLTL